MRFTIDNPWLVRFSYFVLYVIVAGCKMAIRNGDETISPLGIGFGINIKHVDINVYDTSGNTIPNSRLVYNFEPIVISIEGIVPTQVRILESDKFGKIKGDIYQDKISGDNRVFFPKQAIISAPGFLPVIYYGQKNVYLPPSHVRLNAIAISRNNLHFLFNQEDNRILPLYRIGIPLSKRFQRDEEFCKRTKIISEVFGEGMTDLNCYSESEYVFCYAVDDHLLQDALIVYSNIIERNTAWGQYLWMEVPKKFVLSEGSVLHPLQ